MPARGRAVERDYEPAERAALSGAEAPLGETAFDVYLNDPAYWRCVPSRVWAYSLGGYQVLRKWLSYREAKLLGRPLRADEATYLTEVARRIAAILLLAPDLDASYAGVRADTYAWPGQRTTP